MAEHVPYMSKGMGKQFCTAEGVEWPCEAEKQRLRADMARGEAIAECIALVEAQHALVRSALIALASEKR
jgi:hypothetical protein